MTISTGQAAPDTTGHQPLPVGALLPHRKVIRDWLVPMTGSSTARAILLLLFDYLLLAVLMTGIVLLHSVWLKILCGLVAGFITARLFVIGHDACHQSLTSHRRLNKWLGRIAFLPTLTAYSLWDVGHNVVHHGFTNLKGADFVWAPSTQEEYDAMSGPRRWLERMYRSGWGPGLYYMIDIWWGKMMFPSKSSMGNSNRPVFTWDCILVTVFAVLWLAATGAAARLAGQSVAVVWLAGFVLPLIVWFNLMGFVIYCHHTHVKVSWHNDRTLWHKAQPFVSTTVHLTFRGKIGAMTHHIMEHTAHHVDMSIPLYKLKAAQQKLEEMLPGRIVIQPFSWGWYFETSRACKLYDFKRNCWTDFAGRASSENRQT